MFELIVEHYALYFLGERYAHHQLGLRVFRIFHRLRKSAQIYGTRSQHGYIHQTEHLASVLTGLETGAITVSPLLGKYRGTTLAYAADLSVHARCSPRRIFRCVRHVAAYGIATRAYVVKIFGVAAYHARLLDLAHYPAVHVTERQELYPLLSV